LGHLAGYGEEVVYLVVVKAAGLIPMIPMRMNTCILIWITLGLKEGIGIGGIRVVINGDSSQMDA